MSALHYRHPLDPGCIAVKSFTDNLLSDPMTQASGAPIDEILELFGNKHRVNCERCQRYGAANIEIIRK